MQSRWRFYCLLGFLFFAAMILIVRMLDLSIFHRSFLVKQSEARTLRLVDIPAYRGMMKDRHGIPLAISAPVYSIWMNPQTFNATPHQISELARLTHLDQTEIQKKSRKHPGREFVYLTRSMPPEVADQIKALKITGIGFQREYRRFYPSGETAAHVLGFTNVDDQGQEGLELAYENWLHGIPGKMKVIKDRLGQIVAHLGIARQPQEGHDLTLSLDSRIQYLAYTALQTAVPKFNATSGSIIVLDVTTGEILAMANTPSYNPNARGGHSNAYRNRAVTDLFEPGSTMKAFSVASALVSKKYTPNSTIDTRPGVMEIGGRTIHDDSNLGIITVTQVLQRSSNIGAAKLTLSLPPENLWNLLKTMGFGEKTDSGFPGEANGVLDKSRLKRPVDLITLAYGYGLSATLLQLTQAYGILAAHGVKRPITFLKVESPPAGKPVIERQLADQMLILLKAVVEGGGAFNARIPGYQVGGKTGTAYIMGAHGYEKNRYNASFIGIAPITQPRLVVSVVLNGVRGNIHFGSQVAAPVFAQVMSAALRYLNIPPDHPQ